MRRIIVGAVLAAIVGVAVASAQTTTGSPTSFSGAPRVSDLTTSSKALGFALLDPNRLRMRQSYSLSYFSGGGSSGSLGLYSNRLEYDLFKPLTLRVGLSYAHEPFGASDRSAGSVLGSGRLLPSFGLDYHPSDNFLLTIDYRTIPSVVWPYGAADMFRADSRWGLFGPRSW